MRRFATLCTITAIALSVTACNQTADNRDADIKAIQNEEIQWNQDYVRKDQERIVAHYADDAIIMVPGTPATSGKDGIRAALKPILADPALSLRFHPSRVDVAKSGDMAYCQGSYILTLTDPQTKQIIHDHGSYVTTWRKQSDGSWKAVADIANSEVPMPAAPPAAAAHP